VLTRRIQQAALILFIAGVVAGCGASRPVKYYVLDIGPTPANSAAPQFPIVLLVSRITASSLYRDDRLVYGTGKVQLGTYEYQRWAAPPTEMIHEILLRELRGSRRFTEVYPLRSVIHGDYLLRGRLYDFKEVSANSGVVARVNFELELRDNKTFKTVWSYSYHQDEPVTGKDAAAVVAALDKNIARGTQEAVASIEQYFAQNPPQPAAAK